MLFVICDIQRDPRSAPSAGIVFPLLMVKAPGGLPSSLIFIFKMKCRLAGTLEPAKERSFVKPNVCDAGRAKDLPFDRIGASSL